MGYNFTLGEFVPPAYPGDLGYAEDVSLPDAPAFGEPTDYSNQRWPSYSAWAEFAREAGLQHLFDARHERRGVPLLLAQHPGVAVIEPVHLAEIDAALSAYQLRHPGKIAGFPEEELPNGECVAKPQAEQYSPTLARLTWLHFWAHWAVRHCRIPVFVNT